MMRFGRAAAATVALAAGSSGLLVSSGKGQTAPAHKLATQTEVTSGPGLLPSEKGQKIAQAEPQALPAHTFATQTEVLALRTRLSSVVAGFDALLKSEAENSPPPAGSARAKAGAEVLAFVTRLRSVLAERLHNPTLAMEKLEAVKAEVPRYMELALGKSAPVAEASSQPAPVKKPTSPTRTDVEKLRSSFENATSAFRVTQADVDSVRAKLEKVSLGLQGLLGSKLTSLAKAHVEPEVKAFDDELQRVLAETKTMPPADALKKLEAVKARVHKVASDLTSKQEGLMKEAEAQKDSLLLGLLMTLQHAPMDQQLSVLRSADFAKLVVCKALLEKHTDNVPLFQQAADFLDGKLPKRTLQAVVSNATAHHMRVVRSEADITMFEGRISSMAQDVEDRTKAHERRSEQLVDAVKRASGATLPVMEKIAQREEEGFSKFTASQHHDTQVIQEAAAALKRDDVQAAIKAVGALESPQKDLQDELGALESAKQADFVVLGQLGRSSA